MVRHKSALSVDRMSGSSRSVERSRHILIVEDDREISGLMVRLLRQHGFRTTAVTDGRSMDRALEASKVDLVLLDLMLPNESGISLCHRLRATSAIPIIMVTAMGEPIDRSIGLEMGADDYLPKPFDSRELLARIQAVLRRSQMIDRQMAASVFSFAGWHFDAGTRRLDAPDGTRVALTSGEFDLLIAFCQHPRRVLTRDQLLDLTQGRAAVVFDRSIDIQVSRLRRKIEADPKEPELIKTVRAGGYFFTPDVRSP